MSRKRKRKSSVVEIGTGPATVMTDTVNRKDGYPIFSLYWKEGGQRKVRHLACMEEARRIAQQTTGRVANGWTATDEVAKRDLENLPTSDLNEMAKFLASLAQPGANELEKALLDQEKTDPVPDRKDLPHAS